MQQFMFFPCPSNDTTYAVNSWQATGKATGRAWRSALLDSAWHVQSPAAATLGIRLCLANWQVKSKHSFSSVLVTLRLSASLRLVFLAALLFVLLFLLLALGRHCVCVCAFFGAVLWPGRTVTWPVELRSLGRTVLARASHHS